jgi:hypothetical protein
MRVRGIDHSVLGKTMLREVLMGKTGLREFVGLMGHHRLKGIFCFFDAKHLDVLG